MDWLQRGIGENLVTGFSDDAPVQNELSFIIMMVRFLLYFHFHGYCLSEQNCNICLVEKKGRFVRLHGGIKKWLFKDVLLLLQCATTLDNRLVENQRIKVLRYEIWNHKVKIPRFWHYQAYIQAILTFAWNGHFHQVWLG